MFLLHAVTYGLQGAMSQEKVTAIVFNNLNTLITLAKEGKSCISTFLLLPVVHVLIFSLITVFKNT
jgi:hypothetical protein